MTVTAAATAASVVRRPGLPPGPKGAPLLGLALNVLRDPLATLMRVAREYGDIVCIPVFQHHRIMLNHPDFIEQVCIKQHTAPRAASVSSHAHHGIRRDDGGVREHAHEAMA
jgi:hypothetical protein